MRSSRLSPTMPNTTGTPPAARTWPDRLWVLMSRICPSPGTRSTGNHFVSGGDDAHHGAPENADFCQAPQAASRPASWGRMRRAGSQCRFGMADVFALFDHMLARGHTAVSFDGGVVQQVGVLDHDDAVGPLGQHAAGCDPGRFRRGRWKNRAGPPSGSVREWSGMRDWLRRRRRWRML